MKSPVRPEANRPRGILVNPPEDWLSGEPAVIKTLRTPVNFMVHASLK